MREKKEYKRSYLCWFRVGLKEIHPKERSRCCLSHPIGVPSLDHLLSPPYNERSENTHKLDIYVGVKKCKEGEKETYTLGFLQLSFASVLQIAPNFSCVASLR